MRTIYLDSEFKCHVSGDETMQAVETNRFDGKCDAYIEGYRFIPEGQSWTREDGVTFTGEMVAPWKDYSVLAAAQAEYEKNAAELEELRGVTQEADAAQIAYEEGVQEA